MNTCNNIIFQMLTLNLGYFCQYIFFILIYYMLNSYNICKNNYLILQQVTRSHYTSSFLVCLRYLASESFQLSMVDCAYISQSSVSKCVKQRISNTIINMFLEWMSFPLSREKNKHARKFAAIDGIPGVLACIDRTHVPIFSPGGKSTETNRCRKGFYLMYKTLVMLA